MKIQENTGLPILEGETAEVDPKQVEKYIEHLEEDILQQEAYINDLETEVKVCRGALESFVNLLGFISSNFGDTADYPVRIDSDFYNEHFLGLINEAQVALHNVLVTDDVF